MIQTDISCSPFNSRPLYITAIEAQQPNKTGAAAPVFFRTTFPPMPIGSATSLSACHFSVSGLVLVSLETFADNILVTEIRY
jgi:hypothetical protein